MLPCGDLGCADHMREPLSLLGKKCGEITWRLSGRSSPYFCQARLDFEEGADVLMVKPALAYLDIIQLLKQNFPLPIAAYQVSGEYAMIKFAAKAGVINESQTVLETIYAIKRAGADIIFTYFTDELIKLKV